MKTNRRNKQFRIQGKCLFCGETFDITPDGLSDHTKTCQPPAFQEIILRQREEVRTPEDIALIPAVNPVEGAPLGTASIVIRQQHNTTFINEPIINYDPLELLFQKEIGLYKTGLMTYNEFWSHWGSKIKGNENSNV